LSFSFDDIAQLNVPLLNCIEPWLRNTAATAFLQALTWGPLHVWAFAKLTLQRGATSGIKARLERFRAGDLNRLFEEARKLHRPPRVQQQETAFAMDKEDIASDVSQIPSASLERACVLARMGMLSQASRTLDCAKLAPPSAETLKTLQDLHPSHGAPLHSRPLFGEIDLVTEKELLQALNGIGRGSAGGPSGLTRDHVLAMVRVPEVGKHVQTKLTERLNGFLRSGHKATTSPESLAMVLPFFSARLVALEKRCGGVRPVAAGEILRRVLGRVLCQRHSKAIGAVLSKMGQMGIGVRGGVEVVYNAAAAFSSNMSHEDAVLKTDVSNAFNSISRRAMWDGLETLPAGRSDLEAYFRLAYAHPTFLFYNGSKIASIRGVQQGDPLGPLFFSLSFAKAVFGALCRHDIHLGAAFLDDLVVGGPLHELEEFIADLSDSLRDIGLALKPAKCEVITKSPLITLPALVGWQTRSWDNWELVGSPIGSAGLDAFTAKKGTQVEGKLNQFLQLPSPHLALLLAKYSGPFPRLVWWLRSLGPSAQGLWEKADALTWTFLQGIIGPTDNNARWVVHFPNRLGGLGLAPCGGLMSAISRYASLRESAPLIASLIPGLNSGDFVAQFISPLLAIFQAGGLTLPELQPKKVQSTLTDIYLRGIVDGFVNNDTIPARLRRIVCQARSALANTFLNPIWERLGEAELPPQSCVAWVRFRLGLWLADPEEEQQTTCVFCGKRCDALVTTRSPACVADTVIDGTTRSGTHCFVSHLSRSGTHTVRFTASPRSRVSAWTWSSRQEQRTLAYRPWWMWLSRTRVSSTETPV